MGICLRQPNIMQGSDSAGSRHRPKCMHALNSNWQRSRLLYIPCHKQDCWKAEVFSFYLYFFILIVVIMWSPSPHPHTKSRNRSTQESRGSFCVNSKEDSELFSQGPVQCLNAGVLWGTSPWLEEWLCCLVLMSIFVNFSVNQAFQWPCHFLIYLNMISYPYDG